MYMRVTGTSTGRFSIIDATLLLEDAANNERTMNLQGAS